MKYLIELNDLSIAERERQANKTSDAELLDIFAKDENKFVRAAAIRNPATKTKTVNDAVNDPEDAVIVAAAGTAKITESNLRKLLNSEDTGITYVAEKNLKERFAANSPS